MKIISICLYLLFLQLAVYSQPVLQTGNKAMPSEWIDADTHHRVIRLTNNDRSNLSFYFHNNPFVGNNMVYYSTQKAVSGELKQETYNSNATDRQLYLLNLRTFQSERLTNKQNPITGEIVSVILNKAFYQVKDSIFSVDLSTKKETLEYVFPDDFKGSITTINSDGTLLAGSKNTEEEKELFKRFPNKNRYFDLIFEAHYPRTIFTVNLKYGFLNKIFTDNAWLNHVQFSPTDPSLLLFCHEGPWHKVDRIWTVNVNERNPQLLYKRRMPMEIAGHESFSTDGRKIWFDLQQPRGKRFYVAGMNPYTREFIKYELKRDEWSVHYAPSVTEDLFAGDGGDSNSVAKAQNGKWIYLFKPEGDHFESQKLVNMQFHDYKLEPNVHFSPDQKWIIFRANFEGKENIYAVEIKKY